MSLTWTPPRACRDWHSEEDFHEWAEMTQPPVMERPKTIVILIGLAFWALIAVSVFVGRRMGL